MIIYRIQDNNGRGPYKPGFSHLWVQDRPDLKNLIPFYEEFGKDVINQLNVWEYSGIGCKTKRQLRRWFTINEYKRLIRYDYFAVALQVDRVIAASDTQLLFSRTLPLNRNVKIFRLY